MAYLHDQTSKDRHFVIRHFLLAVKLAIMGVVAVVVGLLAATFPDVSDIVNTCGVLSIAVGLGMLARGVWLVVKVGERRLPIAQSEGSPVISQKPAKAKTVDHFHLSCDSLRA
jgi:hypothetical protein